MTREMSRYGLSNGIGPSHCAAISKQRWNVGSPGTVRPSPEAQFLQTMNDEPIHTRTGSLCMTRLAEHNTLRVRGWRNFCRVSRLA